ncbi:MAG: PP2C family protein-serine/threonine phosphatase [Planctomycetaceae bacterium]
MPSNLPEPDPSELRMQCMEVWGGNESATREVELTGLDAWVYCQPHLNSRTGGDVYYLSSCASGRISRLLIADVAGHGDDAGKTARALRELMRRNINYINQTRLVEAINGQFAQGVSGGRFATALVSTYFCPTQSLFLSTAGHPWPVHFDSATGLWRELPDSPSGERDGPLQDLPFGVIEQVSYRQVQLKIVPHDLVLCFSDGLIELPCPNRKPTGLLGTDGLLEVLNSLGPLPPGQIIPELLQQVTGNLATASHSDDLTLVLLRPNGASVPLENSLGAPWRLLRELFRKPAD